MLTGALAGHHPALWWLDPAGGIAISVVIILRWFALIHEQIKKITGAPRGGTCVFAHIALEADAHAHAVRCMHAAAGHTAPPEFIARVNALAAAHSPQLALDCTRAYHFGSRFNVEMEIVLPGDMTVAESHDIALALQHKIEELDDVERAFVHVDYQQRDAPEHKVERELLLADTSSTATPSLQQRVRGRASVEQLEEIVATTDPERHL